MKRTLVFALFTALFFAASDLQAQKIKLVSGSLAFLKGAKEVNVQYDYSNMGVGKFKKEEDYVNKKVTEYNAKEPGRGDSWKASWTNDREARFEPKFEELLNKGLSKNGISFGDYGSAPYTMIVKTTFTEPGYNIVVSRKPAMINLEITFVETGDTKPKAKITLTGAPGNTFGGYDYDTGVRISEAYAKAGKSLAAFIAKSLKK